jgi:2-dehydro-3-deoxyphosphogluconate aldolase / (4S)-4-hydroxy-2-oxoglutarate aldolase
VAIVRGVQYTDIVPIVQALYEGGVKTVEITLNTDRALEMIALINAQFGQKMLVGAGTVLTPKEATEAIDAGAKFIISPHLDIDVIKATKSMGAISIPGAFTPTEIVQAFKYGGDIVKVFPASQGVDFIRDVRAPLPHIPLMPTGGVQLSNIQDFRKAGAVAFGIGTALVCSNTLVNKAYLKDLTHKAQQFVAAVKD